MKKIIIVLIIILILMSACTKEVIFENSRFETLERGEFHETTLFSSSKYWIIKDRETSEEYLYIFEYAGLTYAGGPAIIKLGD